MRSNIHEYPLTYKTYLELIKLIDKKDISYSLTVGTMSFYLIKHIHDKDLKRITNLIAKNFKRKRKPKTETESPVDLLPNMENIMISNININSLRMITPNFLISNLYPDKKGKKNE